MFTWPETGRIPATQDVTPSLRCLSSRFRTNPRGLAILIAVGASFLEVPAFGASQCKNNDCGEISIGRPKLWSLADAQYYVGRARQRLKELRVALPNETFGDDNSKKGVVDPNAVHIRQLDIIMQSLGIDVQHDQESAIRNREARQRYQRETRQYERTEAERDALTSRINEKTLEKAGVDGELEGKTREETLLTSQIDDLEDQIDDLTPVPEDPPADPEEEDSPSGTTGASLPLDAEDEDRLAALQRQLGATQDELRQVEREKAELETESAVLEREIEALTEQRNALGAAQEPELELTSTGPPVGAGEPEPGEGGEAGETGSQPNPLQRMVISKLLEDGGLRDALAARVKDILTKDAEPHYIHQLNNFVDGHLQTISKRLTLLRQSVDPNFDLYFLEASASLTPSRKTKRHIARARWIVQEGGEMDWAAYAAQYVKESTFHDLLAELSAPHDNVATVVDGLDKVSQSCPSSNNQPDNDICRDVWKERDEAIPDLALNAAKTGCSVAISLKKEEWAAELQKPCTPGNSVKRETIVALSPQNKEALLALGIVAAKGGMMDRSPIMPDVKPYIFEMTPTQAALNIARNQLLSKNFHITGLFKTIIGIGGAVRYERQRESYRQFLQQQVFIAGQGKGQSEFGWDFSALPGDKWVAQGAYTAYGVLAVPKFRRSVTFKTKGSWLLNAKEGGRPRTLADDKAADDEHKVYLPSRHDYWVEAMYYDPVPVGEEISVILRGKGFSNETTVLINNTPLDPRWRLIDPNTSEFSYLPESQRGSATLEQSGGTRKVYGAFELMSSDTISMRFRLPDFTGIPQITLLSPHRSVHVTDLPIRVNNSSHVRLEDARKNYQAGKSRDHIFFKPESGWLSIADKTYLRIDDLNQKVDVRLRLVGIDLRPKKVAGVWQDPKVEILNEKNQYQPAPPGVQSDPDEGLLWLRDAPTYEGDLAIRVTPAPHSTASALVDRVAVPFRPSIKDLSVKNGPKGGKTEIAITGDNFAYASKVYFGEKQADIISRTGTKIIVRSPAGEAGAKVTVRVVSRLKRNDMELSSTETNQQFQYDAADKPAKKEALAAAAFEPAPGPQTTAVSARVTLGVDWNAKYSFKAFNGTAWNDVSAARIGTTADVRLTGVPVDRGVMTVQLWLDNETLVEEKLFPVPFKPTLAATTYQSTAGPRVVLRGTNLQLVSVVRFGGKAGEVVSTSYDQATVIAPSGTGKVPIQVTAGPHTIGGADFQY